MNKVLSVTVTFLILLLFVIVPALAQEGLDEDEPNDSMRTATSTDALIIYGEIGRRSDTDDWFVLEGQEGYNPTIILTYNSRECDIDMEVYSDDEVVGLLESTSSPDSDEFDIPGECYLHVYSYDGSGEYTIEIEPDSRTQGGGRRRSNDCEGPDEVEPNDSRRDADLIDGFEIEGYACDGEDDWFVLDGQEGYYPTFTLEYDERDVDIDMEIYSDRDLVGVFEGADGGYYEGDFNVEDTCYLHVYAYDGEGEYYIEIAEGEYEDDDYYNDYGVCEGPDEVEPNDESDQADIITGLYFEGYACEGDIDWFYLDGQEGRNPLITLDYDPDEVDIDIDIYSDDELIGGLYSIDAPDWDEFRIPGECWIMVYSYDGEGWYSIEIQP